MELNIKRLLGLNYNSQEITQITSVSERHYEYPFAIESIDNLVLPINAKILDVGCSGSYLPLILASLGYNVTGSDINNWKVKCNRFNMVIDDIKESKFESSCFDVITLISVIEHVGLDRYGESDSPFGYLKAMSEIYRIIKPDGHLIMTTPYGESSINNKYHFRVHDKHDIEQMTVGFTTLKQYFIAPVYDENIFEYCTEKQAIETKPEKGNPGKHATTLMLLRKI